MRVRTKQRGLRRKCRSMVQQLQTATAIFPAPHDSFQYWHLHLPVHYSFIDSTQTPRSVRRLCMQTLIDCAEHLCSIKPEKHDFCHVVTAIDLPKLSRSQIIVFFGSEYYDQFFERNSNHQKWVSFSDSRSLVKEWKLRLPSGLNEIGFREELRCDYECSDNDLWFLGELENK